MMLTTLEKYFLEFGQLVLPNIGHLRLDQKDAVLLNDTFQPPNDTIVFEPILDNNTKPSKLFYIYLSDHLDCTIEQAMIDYASFFTNQLSSSNTIDLGSLGSLQQEKDRFLFKSKYNSADYSTALSFEKVLSENQTENNFNTNKPNWWLIPLIIALLAVVAILLK